MSRFILLLLLLFAANVQAATITDDFTRGDNADIGTNWDPYPGGSCQIVSNQVQAPSANGACFESWNANSFTDNQYAQITIANFVSPDSTQIALLLRGATPPTETFYRISARHNLTESTKIVKYIAGVVTTIAADNSITWVNGDVLYVEISGTAITVKRNGTTILTGSDSEIASGRIGFTMLEGSVAGDTVADSFSGGDLAAPVGGGARRVMVITQ